ncbi:MAG TPA: glutathione S-transferase family protein [Polyangiaceae bacterium]|nr:glutathione S-transferase family protein [Polyangiaceae bacterium]
MSFELYYHPLSSYCWKALIALYEAEIPFEKHLVDLQDPADRAAFLKVTPLGKFPVLVDTQLDRRFPESSILIEYLAQNVPSAARLVPTSRDLSLQVRAADRFFDLYVMQPMGKIVEDRLRPEGERDPRGVADAHVMLDKTYAITESFLPKSGWAVGADFSLADCAAAPALFYANKVHPLTAAAPYTRAYCERLSTRPSFARVLREAEPFMSMFPG